MNEKTRPLARACRQRLTTIWLIGGGAVLTLLFMQTLNDRYLEADQVVWDWFLPYIVPTVSLMVGVLVANATSESKADPDAKPKTADPFLYRVALGVSVFYLVCLGAVLLMWDPNSRTIDVYLADAKFFVTALQAIVGLSLGAFFVKS